MQEARAPLPEHVVQTLKREALEATLKADRLPFVPPAKSKSMFVQLRRLDMERGASSKKAKLYLGDRSGPVSGDYARKPVVAPFYIEKTREGDPHPGDGPPNRYMKVTYAEVGLRGKLPAGMTEDIPLEERVAWNVF